MQRLVGPSQRRLNGALRPSRIAGHPEGLARARRLGGYSGLRAPPSERTRARAPGRRARSASGAPQIVEREGPIRPASLSVGASLGRTLDASLDHAGETPVKGRARAWTPRAAPSQYAQAAGVRRDPLAPLRGVTACWPPPRGRTGPNRCSVSQTPGLRGADQPSVLVESAAAGREEDLCRLGAPPESRREKQFLRAREEAGHLLRGTRPPLLRHLVDRRG